MLVSMSVGRFWDLGMFRSRLWANSKISRMKGLSFAGICHWNKKKPLFKIKLKLEPGVLPHFK
jgi:hypothetical protein